MANGYEGMKCAVHRSANFYKAVRAFKDKRASLLMSILSAYVG